MSSYVMICLLLLIFATVGRASELRIDSEIVDGELPESILSSDYVFSIQEDITRPGVLLVLSNCTLLEVSENKTVTTLTSWTGSRTLTRQCRSFLQRDIGDILLGVYNCIKQVYRANGAASTLAGDCNQDFFVRDGQFKAARFHSLVDIASIPESRHKVLALERDRVRLLLMDRQVVLTPYVLEIHYFTKMVVVSSGEIYIGVCPIFPGFRPVKHEHAPWAHNNGLQKLNITFDSLYHQEEIDKPTSSGEISFGVYDDDFNHTNIAAVLPLGDNTLLLNVLSFRDQKLYAYNIQTGDSKLLYKKDNTSFDGARVMGVVNSTIYLSSVGRFEFPRKNFQPPGLIEERLIGVDALHMNNYCLLEDGAEEKYYLMTEILLDNGTTIICDIDSNNWEVGWRVYKYGNPSRVFIIFAVISAVCLIICTMTICAVRIYTKMRRRKSEHLLQRPLPPLIEHFASNNPEDYAIPFDDLYEVPDEPYDHIDDDMISFGRQSFVDSSVRGVVSPRHSLNPVVVGTYVINPTVVGDTMMERNEDLQRQSSSTEKTIYVTNPTEA